MGTEKKETNLQRQLREERKNRERLEKAAKKYEIRKACETQNLDLLKKLLPTPKALVDYEDDKGNNILHLLMYAPDKANSANSVDFIQKIFAAYNINSVYVFKYSLLLHRNHKNKLPADSSFIRAIADKKERTEFDENKIALYNFLKEQIFPILPSQVKMDAHKIAKEPNKIPDLLQDKIQKGTPVSNTRYLPQKNRDNMVILDSVKEQYPEIRIRVIGDKDKGIREKSYAITGLDPNSETGLEDQIWDAVDFPENLWGDTIRGILVFEDDYKNLRKNPTAFAMYRYFNQLRGAVVIEDRSESGEQYGGYAHKYIHNNTLEYPIVVINSSAAIGKYNHNDTTWHNQERFLYHELFHQIDLCGDPQFSSMNLFQYAVMLVEQDRQNKITDPFDIVNRNYNDLAKNYNIEMAAQIMGVANPDIYKNSPLLSHIYKLGSCFCIAKANGNNNVLKYLKQADAPFLLAEHMPFIGRKARFPQYTENMSQTERDTVAKQRKELLKQQKEKVDENIRKDKENKLIKIMDEVIKNAENMLSNSAILQKSNERD